ALEYWEVVADAARGWEPAYAGLKRLVAEYPDNLRYRLALAEHVTIRKPDDPAALKTISDIAALPEYQKQARNVWRRAMLRLGPSTANVSLIERYMAGEQVEDSAVKEHLTNIRLAVEQRSKLLADPYYRAKLDGLALLDGGKLEQAEQRLTRSYEGRPTDPGLLGGLGLLRMRQGHHAEAEAYFLQAQQRDPKSSRWPALVRTARFWGLMRAASDAADAGEFGLAGHKLQEARALDPREPAALVALGQLYATQGRNAEAEKTWRAALSIEPANLGALRGLVTLYLRNGREQDAAGLLAALTADSRKDISATANAVRVTLLKEKAAIFLARGSTDEAIAMLEQAAGYDAGDPWLRYDLARLYAGKGEPKKGVALFTALLARGSAEGRADDAEARYAYALFLSNQNQEVAALTTLEGIVQQLRTVNMTGLQRRLWMRVVAQRTQALAAHGQKAAARRLLDEAQRAIGQDIGLALDLADARLDADDIESAHGQAIRLANLKPPSIDWSIKLGALAVRAGADDIVPSILADVENRRLTPEQATAVDNLKISIVLRDAEVLRSKDRLDQALQTLAPARRTHPNDERLLNAEARILRASGRLDQAAENYRLLLALKPDNRDAATSLIDVLIASHRLDEARQRIDWQLAHLDGASEDQIADLIGSLIDLQDYARATELTATALNLAPDSPRALADAGQLARREGRLGDAIDLLQRSLAADVAQRFSGGAPALSTLRFAPAVETAPTPEVVLAPNTADIAATLGNGYAYRRVADMLDQGTTWFSSALDLRTRSGTQGISQYSATEIPLEWKEAQGYGGRWTYHADLVRVSAGTLDLSDQSNAATFGSTLLCQPLCNSGLLNQSASGVALNAALQRDNTRYDIGTTPLGFPVQTVVGGILHKGDIGPFGYSIDIARRALTGTMLSYAGATDPNTGRTWGGVTTNGVRFGLSLDDGGRFGGWSSFGLHSLDGKNVMSNTRMQLMAGGTWRVINEDDRLLQFGLTGMDWRFSENAGGYTFGNGGYYSPQSYRSLSLPVTFGERTARFSYAIRASVSASRSQTQSAPFYPTDATLQAQAEKLSATNFVNPFYSGGSSDGDGRSLALTWEYQATSRLFFGARLELDRSPDYAPNRYVGYLRYAIDKTSAKPVNFVPEPVNPASLY
ncbi:MAG: cellulose synthase subunit BcsC-related outer membrane protein, partial [Burkholderiales bacterium]